MELLLFLLKPLVLLVVAGVWVYCLADALRHQRSWWWVGVLVVVPVLPLPIYLMNFKLHADAKKGLIDERLEDASELKRLLRELEERDLPAIRSELANYYFERGQLGEALPHLAVLLDATPEDLRAQFQAGAALLAAEEPAAARRHLEFVLEENPDFARGQARLVYANALLAEGEKLAALREYARVSEQHGLPEAAVRQARLMAERGEAQAAAVLLRDVLGRAGSLPREGLGRHRPWLKQAAEDLRRLEGN